MSDPNSVVKSIYRVCFGRSGAAIWLGHLDMMRTFERSLSRARLPVSYSRGFNPRPELVFALPAGVGIETINDYLDISLTAPEDESQLVDRLNQSLPADIRVRDGWQLKTKTKNMMGLVKEADYLLEFPGAADLAARLMSAGALEVERTAKGKTRAIDLRPLLIEAKPGEQADQLRVRCYAGSARNLRMDSLCDALHLYFDVPRAIVDDARLVREELYIQHGDKIEPPSRQS